MAAADVLLPLSSPSLGVGMTKRKRSLSSAASANMAPQVPRAVQFDAARHLRFKQPDKTWTMEEIGLANIGVSPVAVSEPFPLFTEEAIQQMRAEVLSKPVRDHCTYSSNLAQNQLRGFAPEFAPFVYDAWRSPAVLEIVSKLAGVELVPAMDFEIAHINISTPSPAHAEAAQEAFQEKSHRDADEGVAGCPYEDDQPIVGWHTDSYPFVCVTMLSDCTHMLGGETALRRGDGGIMKVRGPAMGHAVILQGRYIEHQALRALGASERISMVTSFRPKSAFIKDDTVLTTVRAVSDLSELYSQYSEYRFEMLEERVRAHLKAIRDRKRARNSFNTAETKAFIIEQQAFLESMLHQIVDEDQVIAGFTDGEAHLLSADLKAQSRKKIRYESEEAIE